MRGLAQKSFEAVSKHWKKHKDSYTAYGGIFGPQIIVVALFAYFGVDESKLPKNNEQQNGVIIWPIPGIR